MNSVLQLKGRLKYASNSSGPRIATLPKGGKVTSRHVLNILDDLRRIVGFWRNEPLKISPLVAVHYCRVIPKSRRISRLFSHPNDSVRGAKYSDDTEPRLIITYQVENAGLLKACASLEAVAKVIDQFYQGTITSEDIDAINKGKHHISFGGFSQAKFRALVKDVFSIEHLRIPNEGNHLQVDHDMRLVTLFDVGISENDLLGMLGMQNEVFPRFKNLTWQLNPRQYATLLQKASYLISMSVTDLRLVSFTPFRSAGCELGKQLPRPNGEPVIGVIDTPCNPKVYFHDWIDMHNLVYGDISSEDYEHGTAIDSLLIDGPALNPVLEDECGRFQVRHFGVVRAGKTSSFTLMRMIQDIVSSNRDIKVWNLSLGAQLPVNPNCISPEAAILDELQTEYDVVFVVAGTNNNNRMTYLPPLCPPADSINSVVVNSVQFNGQPAEYSRQGPVLRYYQKPDVCAYGGDRESPVHVYSQQHDRISDAEGTSFAAPWIARKLAFLIEVMKYSKETAKALVIDAAAGWDINTKMCPVLGFGRVPTKISSIIQTPDDEIKFIVRGTTNAYQTFAFNIPVPQTNHSFPYLTKATLCYFPQCNRNQGVDYTNTELDFHFGRVTDGKIKSINNNTQGEQGQILYEIEARKNLQKWNNVKHISERSTSRARARKVYSDSSMWGFLINKMERLNTGDSNQLAFSAVITLKNINGENRYREFIKLCEANNWFVVESNVETMMKNYVKSEEEIYFTE